MRIASVGPEKIKKYCRNLVCPHPDYKKLLIKTYTVIRVLFEIG